MFAYELRLALMSFRKNPVLTGLMITAIAVGIGVCMTTVTMYYLMSDNPIAHKNDQLYAVQLDSWDPVNAYDSDNEMPFQLTWNDANALLQQAPDYPRAAMYKSVAVVETSHTQQVPLTKIGRVTSSHFFSMFDIPFQYGASWDQTMEQQARRVVVISQALNEELFGGEDSTGQELRIDNKPFQIVGVLQHWHPAPKYYDLNNRNFGDPEDYYIPISLTEPMRLQRSGNNNCWKTVEGDGFLAHLNSECVWLQYWVELNNQTEIEEYHSFLSAYINDQKATGRFQRPSNFALSNVQQWLDLNHVVSNDSKVLVGLAFMFLAVCVFNTIGLLLTKFLGRSSETGIRRALGATRQMIFRQHLVEVGTIGLIGGFTGIGLSWLGLKAVAAIAQTPEALVQLDGALMLAAIALAIIATLVAGLYPSWHIGRTAPARYLKA